MINWSDFNWPDFVLQGAARWIAGGGALAGAAGIVLSQTVFSPDYEILYSGGVDVAQCASVDDRRRCAFVYRFSIGNTGKLGQETLRVEWPLDLKHLGIETRVADIVASAEKTAQPKIMPVFESDRTVYTIDGLMPNTMVGFNASCLACTPEQLQAMRQAQPLIVARGTIEEGDPRVSALRRGASNVLRVVGLFQ
ncbi:MAG: hypothetical protein IH604_21600 [Burkholderiales bacterium]|nr:hypothetical protein [Burkholderiales bacterium]